MFRAFLPANWIDAYLVVAVPVAFLFAGSIGVILERSVIRFLYGRALETLLATWGVSLILQQAVRSIFGSPNKEVSNPSWMTGGFDLLGGFTVTWSRLYIIVFCFIVLGALGADPESDQLRPVHAGGDAEPRPWHIDHRITCMHYPHFQFLDDGPADLPVTAGCPLMHGILER